MPETHGSQWAQIKSGDRHGSKPSGQSSDMTGVAGNLAMYAGDGWLTDSNVPASFLGTTTAPPVLRGVNSGTGTSSATITVSWPTGTVAGDLAVVFACSDWPVSNPSGWTSLYNVGGFTWNTQICSRVLTSGDISTGHVAISTGGANDWLYIVCTFQGATGGVLETDPVNAPSSSPVAVTTSASPVPGDAALYFVTSRSGAGIGSLSINRGSPEQSVPGTNVQALLYAESLTAPGAVTTQYGCVGETIIATVIVSSVEASSLAVWVGAPSTHTTTGIPGQMAYDALGNLYWCYSINLWARIGPGGYSNSF